MIKSLNEINTKTDEGKLLIMALARLASTVDSDKEPDTIVELCNENLTVVYPEEEAK